MRLVQVNSVANSGSTGRIAEYISRQAMQAGFESYVAYGQYAQPGVSATIKIGTRWDLWWHGLVTRLTDRHGLASKQATKKFLKKLEHVKPDVIGLHNIHGYYIHYPLLFEFIKTHGVPVVWTLHDCWSFTGHCAHFMRVSCNKWQQQCGMCPLTKQYPASFGWDHSAHNYRLKKHSFTGVKKLQLITPSHWLKNEVKKSFLQEYPVEVIYNGIDLKTFAQNKSESEKLILGVASTWSSAKGLNDFIQLRSLLNAQWKIVLIGLTKKQILSLPEGIVGIQRTESISELVSWYNRATVFVNPTYVDNFPTTNLEALACGTPVVTYNTGGSPEAIDEDTGRVVPVGAIKELAGAVETMAAPGKNQWSSQCRKRAEKFFNMDHQYADYVRIYRSMIH